jgi:hypothetical protein
VRDESAREELEREVGKIGLVLTVLESKGLEFDDVSLLLVFRQDLVSDSAQVLLVNFFRGIYTTTRLQRTYVWAYFRLAC